MGVVCGVSVHSATVSLQTFVQLLQFLVKDEKYGHKLLQSVDEKENSPLHISSERGNLEAVKILLDYGASGGTQNQELKTPMHLAAVTGMEQ